MAPKDEAVNNVSILGPGPSAQVTVPAVSVRRGSPGTRRVAAVRPTEGLQTYLSAPVEVFGAGL
jgi:hypothetical protein